jgi:hypothetical protein
MYRKNKNPGHKTLPPLECGPLISGSPAHFFYSFQYSAVSKKLPILTGLNLSGKLIVENSTKIQALATSSITPTLQYSNFP